MPRRIRRQFIWIPPNRNTKWSVTLGSTDVTDDIIGGQFTRSIVGEEMNCNMTLDNNEGRHTDAFESEDDIIFKMDFIDGTTVQFKGFIEDIKKVINDDNGFVYEIMGSHFTAQLLDIMVTKDFSNLIISDILESIIDEFLTGFTKNNIDTISTITSIKWINKPFFDCVIDLMKLGNLDCFVDNDKDFHLFIRDTKPNDNEAVVWNDSLIQLNGLGQDSTDVRNDVTVYGEAGGLPVIANSTDSTSNTKFRKRERVITNKSIQDEDVAKSFGDADILVSKNPPEKGSASTLFMPQLNPGDSVYIISPPHKVHSRFRLIKYIFNIPDESMELFFSKELGITKLLKERIQKDEGEEDIVNPNSMKQSFNFGTETGFNSNKIDGSSSDNIIVTGGELKMDGSVESANMVSIQKDTSITVNSVEVRVIGESLTGTNYYINAEGTNNWQQITLNTDTIVTTTGKKLRLRIELTTTTTRINSAAVYYK